MTPKEKAEDLVGKFKTPLILSDTDAGEEIICTTISKECALIAVDEIIYSRKDDTRFNDTLSSTSSEYYTPHPMYLTYWNKVKTEIEKL